MHTAIRVHGLTVHYEANPVLWDINLEVPTGKFVGILGPNGAGKSTFMKALLGFIPAIAGTTHFFGKPLAKVRGRIAYIPQQKEIDWDFPITVKELVLMGRYPRLGLFRPIRHVDHEAAEKVLREVGMEEFSGRQIRKLSGGQQQRAFLARALLQEADLYFLDEPLTGIDHTSQEIILSILHNMRAAGKTILMVHHDLNSAPKYFDWAILLNLRLVAAGEFEAVFQQELLQEAYGKNFVLYDEVSKLGKTKKAP